MAVILAVSVSAGALALAMIPYGGPPEHLQAVAHAGAFLVISVLFVQVLPSKPWGGLAVAFCFGIAIEAVQVFVPGREASLGDLAANLTGILGGAAVHFGLKALRTTPH